MKVYIVDSNNSGETGAIHVFDLASGERLHSIETGYHPDLAVQPDGSKLYVVETDLGQEPARHRLVVYDGDGYREEHRVDLPYRALYNVMPQSPGLRVSQDGGLVYVQEVETLGDDEARYSIGILSADGAYRGQQFHLPHNTKDYGELPGRPGLYFATGGKGGEKAGYGEPDEGGTLDRFADTAPNVRGEEAFIVAASAPDPGGSGTVYHVSRRGELRVFSIDRNNYSEPVRLSLPHDKGVPIRHLLAADSRLYVGTATAALCAQGKSEAVWVCEVDRGSVYRIKGVSVWPPSEALALSPDGSELLALSREGRCLTAIDLESALVRRRIDEVGTSPVAFAVAA